MQKNIPTPPLTFGKKTAAALIVLGTIGITACGKPPAAPEPPVETPAQEVEETTLPEGSEQTENPAEPEETEDEITEEIDEEPDAPFEDDGSYEIDGDHIIFGRYEQDGDLSNGPEPISWDIIAEDDDSYLLISSYILDCQRYHSVETDVTWETCDLRAWLNGDFYYTAFSKAGRKRILTTQLSNTDNIYFETDSGNDTEDKLFCLSVDEILEYFPYETWYDENQIGLFSELITDMTPYAESRGADHCTISQDEYDWFLGHGGYDSEVIGLSSGEWWLRTAGLNHRWVCYVDHLGRTGWGGYSRVEFGRLGVRPALSIEK